MQGRLSPVQDSRIQAFPWAFWRDEFAIASQVGFNLMEWTLDLERLRENPLLTASGQAEITQLSRQTNVVIPSLTGDCFMQAPFWKAQGGERESRQSEFRMVLEACEVMGISIVVVPLVDNGRIESSAQEDVLVAMMEECATSILGAGIRIVVESDLPPQYLSRFIGRLDTNSFGINYDIGNSAALGYDPSEEIAAYGDRIVNVHVKDRRRNGTTVPLTHGEADFEAVFGALARVGYAGNYILQTARAADGDHARVLLQYRSMVEGWLRDHAA